MKRKLNYKRVVVLIFVLLIMTSSIMIGLKIKENGKEIISFCSSHYKNETFLDTIVGDEPARPKQCIPLLSKKVFSLNNTPYQNCLENNASDDQITFMKNCQWMGPDYLILAGSILFIYVFPFAIFAIFMICVVTPANERRRL